MGVFSAILLSAVAVVAAVASPLQYGDPCLLTGTYSNESAASLRECDLVVIDSLSVPAGMTLNLTKVKNGSTILFKGTTTFGTQLWDGPLIRLQGSNLTVTGGGTLDGQGSWYWPYGQSVSRPVFFKMNRVDYSTLVNFKIVNMPYRTFSVGNSVETLITGLTLDSRAGDGLAKNTDGFDISKNDRITIANNLIMNQDDCLAMQSSTNTLFADNTCIGGHGISIGSLGGPVADSSTTVSGLTVINNRIINNTNGLRIKTIIDLNGVVANVAYINNYIENVTNAITVRSDYIKTKGGYSGMATSLVTITNITIAGLVGTATNLYDVYANPNVVSNWDWSGIYVESTSKGKCVGQPSEVICETDDLTSLTGSFNGSFDEPTD